MREIDLHNLTVDEAMKFMKECMKQEWKSGKKSIKIIHGYGSGGNGGKIKKSVREFLNNNRQTFEYITGEGIDLNQGYTVVKMKNSIETSEDELEYKIIEFCIVPKTLDKITGEFRRSGSREVALIVAKLVKSGKLREGIKGKYKCYEKV